MRGIINSSISFRFLVIIITVILIVFGINQMVNMPVDVLPEFSPPYVEIQTEALGLSAKEVEQMITVPMEQDLLAGVAWLDVIQSESVPGLSSVLVYFEPGTNLFQARQMVAERLSQAAVGLPHVSKPPTMIQPLSSTSRFMIIGLSSSELSLIQMSVLARWTIAPRLMGVPGVANVSIWGNRDRQLQVQVDPNLLNSREVTLEQVIETTGNALWVSSLSFLEASTPGTGGFIDTPNQRLSIWHILPISSPEELAQVPIEGAESLQLSDVAKVVEDHQPLIGDALVNDSPNLMLVIEKLPGTNTLEVTKDVERALDLLRPGFTAIDFNATIFRPATFIEMAITNLTRTFVIAAILFVLILGVIFFNWRVVVISLVSIIFSLVASLYVLYLRGATLNAMVLAGLVVALGVLIDDAIVDVGHIVYCLRVNREKSTPRSSGEVIREALVEIRSVAFFAALILLLAVTPVFFLEGVTSALFRTIATTYILAVLAALLAGLTITTALSFVLFSRDKTDRLTSPLSAWINGVYHRLLQRLIGKTRLAFVLIIIFVLAGAAVLPFLGKSRQLPTFKEPYLLIDLEAAPGTSQLAIDRIVSLVSAELRTIEGVQDVGAHVGRAVFGDQVVGINSAQLWVQIDSKTDYDATLTAINQLASEYTGITLEVQTYSDKALSKAETGSEGEMVLRIYGEEQEVLLSEAKELQGALSGIAGVSESRVILPVEEPGIEIEVNLEVAQQYGIKPGDVRRTAATLLSGIQVGSLFEEQKIFDVVVWSIPENRDSISDVRNLMIDTPTGGQVRLGELADVRMVASPTVIRREAVSPYIDINFTVHGRDAREVSNDINSYIQNYNFPLEYHAELQSDYSSQPTVLKRALIAGLVALLGIFLLLQATTRNWRMALAILLTLPAALAGGVIAAFISSGSVSPLGLFGLLSVLGISIRATLLTINQCQHLGYLETFSLDLVVHGSSERAVPTLMTALITGLVFLTIIIFGSIPGHEILYPIAVVTLGGLISSTVYNLFILPVLYLRYGDYQELELELVPEPTANLE